MKSFPSKFWLRLIAIRQYVDSLTIGVRSMGLHSAQSPVTVE